MIVKKKLSLATASHYHCHNQSLITEVDNEEEPLLTPLSPTDSRSTPRPSLWTSSFSKHLLTSMLFSGMFSESFPKSGQLIGDQGYQVQLVSRYPYGDLWNIFASMPSETSFCSLRIFLEIYNILRILL